MSRRRSVCLTACRAGLIAMLGGAGCQSYQSVPLTRETVDAGLSALDLDNLAHQYQAQAHPNLPDLVIDPADGISPFEAACVAAMLNPSLRSARARRGISEAQLIQAGLLPNPQFGATLDIPAGGSTAGTVNAVGVGLSWDVTALIEHRANLEAAKASERAAVLDLAWQEWQVASSARLAATQAVFRAESCLLLRDAADQAAQFAESIRRARDMGQATDLDVAAAESILQSYLTRLRAAERDRDLAALEAKRAMGLSPGDDVHFVRSEELPPELPSDAEVLFELAREHRVDLAALRYGYEAQEDRVRAAVLSQFPRLNFGLNAARDTGNVQTLGVGISVDLPVFDRSQGRIASERATREMLFSEYIEREFALRADLAALLTELTQLEPAIESQEAYAEASQRALDRATQDEIGGLVDVFAVRQLQAEAVDARITLVEYRQRREELTVVLSTETGFQSGGTD